MDGSMAQGGQLPPVRKARLALIATTLGLMAVVAVIVSSEPIDFSGRGDGRTVVLSQAAADPFDQELAAAQAHTHQASASQEKGKKAGAAARLLEKARTELKTRAGAINGLVTAAKAEDVVAEQKEREAKGRQALPAPSVPVPVGKLHMVSGWGQRGGAMPTTYQPQAFDSSQAPYPYDEQDEQGGREGEGEGEGEGEEDYDRGMPAVGVVDGGSGVSYAGGDDGYANSDGGYANSDGGYYSGGGDVMAPFRWFLQGFAAAKGQQGPEVHVYVPESGPARAGEEEEGEEGYPEEEEEGEEEPEEGEGEGEGEEEEQEAPAPPATPEVERVEDLLKVKAEQKALRQQEKDLTEGVYDDASNGRLASMQDGSEGARAFAAGFLKGAVEGSKKSVEAQGRLAEQLSRQAALVDELEHIVRSLEDLRRKDNFDKTAGAIAAPQTTAPTPLPATPPPAPQAPVPKFKIDFYMESECPGCKSFTTSALTDALNALADHIQLRAIPYGNANLNGTKIMCQHGHAECAGNKVMLCMMEQYPDWTAWFPAFKCIESSDKPPLNVTRKCLSAQGMDVDAVMQCADGEQGELLHLKAAKETLGLDPPHKFTPWVVVDGKPLGDKVMDLLPRLCKKLPPSAAASVDACHPQFKAPLSPSTSQLSRGPQFCYP